MRITKQTLNGLRAQVEDAETIDQSEDGKAIIDIDVNSVEDFYSPYSPQNYKLLNPDVVDYISNFTHGIPANKQYEIRIAMAEVDATAKSRIKNTIRRTYVEKIVYMNAELKRNLIKSLLFFAIGLMFLAGVIVANSKGWNFGLYNVLDIMSWVFLWEGVDTLFMERFKFARKKIKYAKLALADIKFKEK